MMSHTYQERGLHQCDMLILHFGMQETTHPPTLPRYQLWHGVPHAPRPALNSDGSGSCSAAWTTVPFASSIQNSWIWELMDPRSLPVPWVPVWVAPATLWMAMLQRAVGRCWEVRWARGVSDTQHFPGMVLRPVVAGSAGSAGSCQSGWVLTPRCSRARTRRRAAAR